MEQKGDREMTMKMSKEQILEGLTEGTKQYLKSTEGWLVMETVIYAAMGKGTEEYLKSTEAWLAMETVIDSALKNGVENWLERHKDEVIKAIAESARNKNAT
jgi:hypothetical protein